MKMLKNLGKKLVVAMLVGAVFAASYALASQIAQGLQSEYMFVNLTNWTTSGLPANATKGKVGYNSTLNQITFEDGTSWYSVFDNRNHLQFKQLTAPGLGCIGLASGVSTCGQNIGTLNANSTDTHGSIVMGVAQPVISFAAAFTNTPDCRFYNKTRPSQPIVGSINASSFSISSATTGATGWTTSDTVVYDCVENIAS